MLECKKEKHYEDMKTARNEQNVKPRICNLWPGAPSTTSLVRIQFFCGIRGHGPLRRLVIDRRDEL
jgi:hypothetical protein